MIFFLCLCLSFFALLFLSIFIISPTCLSFYLSYHLSFFPCVCVSVCLSASVSFSLFLLSPCLSISAFLYVLNSCPSLSLSSSLSLFSFLMFMLGLRAPNVLEWTRAVYFNVTISLSMPSFWVYILYLRTINLRKEGSYLLEKVLLISYFNLFEKALELKEWT
jgi:hypothetical protein